MRNAMFVRSIKFKNILWFIMILSILFLMAGFVFYTNLEKKLYNDIDAFLMASAVSVADSIDTLWEDEQNKALERGYVIKINETIRKYFFKIIKSWVAKNWDENPNFLNIIVQIFDERGNQIISSTRVDGLMKLPDHTKESVLKKKNHFEDIDIEATQGKSLRVRVLSLPRISYDENANRISYVVRVAIPLRTLSFALTNIRLFLTVIFPIIIILISFIGLYLTKMTLDPVNRMMTSIKDITAYNLKMRIDIPESRDEMHKLAETFNDMLERLDNAFSSQQQLIEDLSHEIKTPLSVIKGQIEVAVRRERSTAEYKELLLSNVEEINRIIKLVENLLIISMFDSKTVDKHFKHIDLSELLNSMIYDIKILGEQRNIKIDYYPVRKVIINGDEVQLKSMFLNLFDNAMKYNVENGRVLVKVEKSADSVCVEITDTGKGIPDDELPYIFDRYYRAIKSKREKGFGIGLSLVKSIVDIHQGKIEVRSKTGNGTTFLIHLPVINQRH